MAMIRLGVLPEIVVRKVMGVTEICQVVVLVLLIGEFGMVVLGVSQPGRLDFFSDDLADPGLI